MMKIVADQKLPVELTLICKIYLGKCLGIRVITLSHQTRQNYSLGRVSISLKKINTGDTSSKKIHFRLNDEIVDIYLVYSFNYLLTVPHGEISVKSYFNKAGRRPNTLS